jgi:hypothetical protein
LLGIAVRGNNNFSDYYAFVIGPTRLDPNFAIWKIQGGSITKWIQNYTAHPAIYPGTVWNTLKVIAKGNNFEFYCNDNLLWSGPIAGAPSKGKIGLYVWTYSGDDECHYESVSLKLETLTALGLNKAKTGIPSSPKSGDPNKIK